LVSPDNKMMCFFSLPPAPEPALFLSDIEGQNLIEVSPNRKNCIWKADSSAIFYENILTPDKSSDIFIFDLKDRVEKNITKEVTPPGKIRKWEIVGMSADSSKLICKYEDQNAKEGQTGSCEIDLETFEVKII